MLRRLAHHQPDSFAFTADNLAWAEAQIRKYPEGRQASAVIPLLWRAQEQEGWLSRPAIELVADMLGMAYIRALEVATFYFMFQLHPVGKVANIQICGTLSCMICGAEDLVAVCKEKIAATPHTLSEDGALSWEEVECLGACANAPMAQIGKDYYEDLTTERLAFLIDELRAGRVPQPGPQNGRFAAEPKSGLTSLKAMTGGHTHNGSVTLANQIGDTIRRIDGTEVPLVAPWIRTAPAPDTAAKDVDGAEAKAGEPTPGAGSPVTKNAATVQEANATATAKPAADVSAPDVSAPGAEAGEAAAPAIPESDWVRPQGLTAARASGADDLKRIIGVGPVLENLLHTLGFYHFDQLAGWSAAEIAWVDENLEGFKGRVTRDKWVAQAKILAEGGSDDDLKKVK